MIRTSVRLLVIWSALGLPFTGCVEPPNLLDGSIEGGGFSLTFEEVRIRSYPDTGELQIEYLRPAEEEEALDVIVALIIDVPDGGVPLNAEIDFEQVNAVVDRHVTGGDSFPPVERGRILFTAGGGIGEQTTGDFSLMFDNGRTLRGRFDAIVEEAISR